MNIPCHFMTAFRFSGLKGAEAICFFAYHICAKHINVAFQPMHSNSSYLHLTIKCRSDPTLIARNHKTAREERFYCWQQQCSAKTYLLVFSAWKGRERRWPCRKASIASENIPRMPHIRASYAGQPRVDNTTIKDSQGNLMCKYDRMKATDGSHFPNSSSCPDTFFLDFL